MKPLFSIFILLISVSAAWAQSPQSPLAPPVLPPSAAPRTSLKVGDKAPDFALPNGDGKLVVLSEYTARMPVVLVFYRGYW
jgi:AhpC/TSA family